MFIIREIDYAILLNDQYDQYHHLLMVDGSSTLTFINYVYQNGHYWMILESSYTYASRVTNAEAKKEAKILGGTQ